MPITHAQFIKHANLTHDERRYAAQGRAWTCFYLWERAMTVFRFRDGSELYLHDSGEWETDDEHRRAADVAAAAAESEAVDEDRMGAQRTVRPDRRNFNRTS
jgi:hypothetical protein